MRMVTIDCPWCEADLAVDLEQRAEELRCAECSTRILVSDGPSPALAEAA